MPSRSVLLIMLGSKPLKHFHSVLRKRILDTPQDIRNGFPEPGQPHCLRESEYALRQTMSFDDVIPEIIMLGSKPLKHFHSVLRKRIAIGNGFTARLRERLVESAIDRGVS